VGRDHLASRSGWCFAIQAQTWLPVRDWPAIGKRERNAG
jgi:hypothetical protein